MIRITTIIFHTFFFSMLNVNLNLNPHLGQLQDLVPDVITNTHLIEYKTEASNTTTPNEHHSSPEKIDWKLLTAIEYELKYFEEFEMEIETPVFSEEVKAINGKKVTIEGFVIPLDEAGDVLALSQNPFATCFFCGNASPASIISMYLKDDGKRYKADAFKKFSGTLILNKDDPNEFYYILQDAIAE